MGEPDSEDLKVRNALRLSKHSPVVRTKLVLNAGTSTTIHTHLGETEEESDAADEPQHVSSVLLDDV